MSESTKYDLFMKEIESLEQMVQGYVADTEIVTSEKINLKQKVESLSKENEVLVLKIKELEKKLNTADEKSSLGGIKKTNLDLQERQNLKNQIDDLIARIDYHIRS
ncbi:MAG: hypothetical protein IPH62_13610 [Ignavibacteriae bacterium]|nr:hypothetical protein [Ignavibacteriota bacterium]